MKGIVWLCVVAAAFVVVLSPVVTFGQEPRDPLIAPTEGEKGSRFQLVGRFGWTPGAEVTLRFALTASDPLSYAGPFAREEHVTVLRDGTWSFPVVLTDAFLPFAYGDQPAYVVVRAESGTKTATNAFVLTLGGRRPAGAEAIGGLGFGFAAGTPPPALTAALFAFATGALLIISGAGRVLSSTHGTHRPLRARPAARVRNRGR